MDRCLDVALAGPSSSCWISQIMIDYFTILRTTFENINVYQILPNSRVVVSLPLVVCKNKLYYHTVK